MPEAFPILSLKYDEAMELAYFGAQVRAPTIRRAGGWSHDSALPGNEIRCWVCGEEGNGVVGYGATDGWAFSWAEKERCSSPVTALLFVRGRASEGGGVRDSPG